MAVTSGVGHSRVLKKRRFEDYQSLKQHYKVSNIEEVIISGSCTTNGAAAEISFVTGDVVNYIGAEGTPYIRCEADDANQHSKYVYVQYQDDTGAVQDWITGDLNAADSTTEVTMTVTDFYRVRQMYSEVESASGGGKMVTLCDADWDGGADGYAYISDGQSEFALERFFTQPDSTHKSYLAYVKLHVPEKDHDGAESGYIFTCQYTPQVNSDGGESAAAADVTETFNFSRELIWEPCIELDGGTEVIFSVGDLDSAGVIHIEAVLLEVLK